MKLGLQLGYWGAQPPDGRRRAGRRRRGRRLRRGVHRRGLGLGRVHAAGLVGPRDLPDAARHLDRADVRPHADLDRDARADAGPPLAAAGWSSGMGVCGPQVVEGWYGQPFSKPLARTREVVDIIRQVLAREAPVTNDGPHYPLPYTGEGVGRARQAAEADRAPAARRHPDLARRRGAEERRPDRRDRRRLDPDLLHAEVGRDVPAVARRGLRPRRARGVPARDFEIAATCHLQITERRRAAGVIDALQAVDRALHGRHGRQGAELPQEGLRADGVRRPRRRGAGAVPRRPARTRPPR